MKTLFDPCPAGWRVPASGAGSLSPWNAFTADNGPWINDLDKSGRYFDQSVVLGPSAAWIPCPGVRASESSGIISWTKADAHFWTSTPSGTYAFRFYSANTAVDPSNSIRRSRGNSVRCVRE